MNRSDFLTTYMIVAGIVTMIAALVGTLLVGKDVNRQMKEYEEKGDTFQDELQRSHDYETTSLKYNIKRLSWIYVALGLATLIVCIGIFIYG